MELMLILEGVWGRLAYRPNSGILASGLPSNGFSNFAQVPNVVVCVFLVSVNTTYSFTTLKSRKSLQIPTRPGIENARHLAPAPTQRSDGLEANIPVASTAAQSHEQQRPFKSGNGCRDDIDDKYPRALQTICLRYWRC